MAEEPSPLEREIRRLIAVAGPMPVADYMRLCSDPSAIRLLRHARCDRRRRRFHHRAGNQPDVRRADRIMDGGGLAADGRAGKCAPRRARTRSRYPDARRVAGGKIVKDFHAAIVLHLVEISPKLQKTAAAAARSTSTCRCLWHASLADVPGGPIIIVANEFIDALPVHQAVKQADGWHERVVEIAPDGNSRIGTARDPLPHFDATLPRAIAAVAPKARSMNGAPTPSRLKSAGACATTARR